QIGQLAEPVARQWLLDHQEVQLVHLAPGSFSSAGVMAVAVRAQRDAWESRRHRTQHVHVPARHDLELDPAIALGETLVDLRQQLVHSVLDPEALADCHGVAYAAPELAEGAPQLLR